MRPVRNSVPVLCLAAALWIACAGAARPGKPAVATIGVDVAGLSPTVSNPYAPFSQIKRAVFAGYDLDDETRDTLETRVEMTVREAPEKVAGADVTVAEFTHYEQGKVVERAWEYFAQDASGAVFMLGRKVDDIEEGKVVGHVGQWIAGTKGARAGLYMPAAPAVGGLFEQSADSRSRVTRVGSSLTVPAGDFQECLETDVTDPITKARSSRVYCQGKGRVRESSSMHVLQLVELELRTQPPQAEGK